jgi:hypothetical protein
VKLRSIPAGTSVAVDSDVVLAGALGSVGQKVIARQASKVTAEFAANLQRALSGEAPPRPPAGLRAGPPAGGARPGDVPAGSPFPSLPAAPDPWSRVAAALSGVSVLLSVAVLVRQRRRAQ